MRDVVADSPECDADPFKAAFAWARSARYWAFRAICSIRIAWRARRQNHFEWAAADIREAMEALRLALDDVIAANPWIVG